MIMGTYHGNEKIHTALYAAEYCYKFNSNYVVFVWRKRINDFKLRVFWF